MKKIILITGLCSLLSGLCFANPFFADGTRRSVGVFSGWGVNSGFLLPSPSQFVPFIMAQLQYAQAGTFFGLYARDSLNVYQTVGFDEKYNWRWQDFSIPIAQVAKDIALFHGDNWYFAAGVSAGFQLKENDRINSKLLFGFRTMFGYRIMENITLEVFSQHFSNGNTNTENNSYGFYGIGFTHSF